MLPAITIGSGLPKIVITANIHGDEVCGIAVIHRLAKEHVKGTIRLYPTLNPIGLEQGVRFKNKDLNRLFPGSEDGHDEIFASTIWKEIINFRPDLVIDLHGDNSFFPYIILDRLLVQNKYLARHCLKVAKSSGLTTIWDYPEEEYRKKRLYNSLTGSLLNKAEIPSFTLEIGPIGYIHPESVDIGFNAILRILSFLGLTSKMPSPEKSLIPGEWQRFSNLRCLKDGLLIPIYPPGKLVEASESLAEIRSIEGKTLETLSLRVPCFNLSWLPKAWVKAGSFVGNFAIPL